MTVQTHRFFKTAALMLALILSANMILPLQGNIFATTVYAAGDEEPKGEGQEQLQESNEYWLEKNIDTSFPYQIRMATNYANRVIGAGKNIGDPIGTEGENYTGNLKMSNIAPFLGFTPGEVEDHILHRQESQRSARDSISATKYSRQLIYAEGGHGKTKAKGAAQYYKYGLTLSLMGFDSVGTEDVDNRRKTIGLVSMVAYYAASSVNVIFDQMFKILIDTNPFQFFKAATMEVGADVLDKIEYSKQSDDAMKALAEFIGPIYDLFVNFSWAVTVPLALIFVIVAFFITHNTSNAVTGFKKFMIRVIFLVMGIPILACAYTDVLTKLSEINYYADDFAVEMISRTFCDFRSWVEQNRLGIPDGADVNIRSIGSESKDTVLGGTTILDLRETCLQLNKANKTFDLGTDLVMETDADSGVVLKKLDKLVINNTEKPDKFDGTANRTKVMSVLGDYFYGVKYTASEFQTGTDGYLEASNVKYGDLFALSSDPYSFSPDSTIKVTGMMNNNSYYKRNDYEGTSAWQQVAKDRFAGGFADYGIGAKIWNNGYDGDVTSFESFKGCSAAGGASETGGTGDDISGKEKAGLNPGNDGGFSTMAMYTYLTTEFDQSGMTVYNGAPSQFTQKEHYAINLIGCNYVMQFLFFLNTVALLLGYFVLALAYGFRTIFDILFKGIQLIGHALLAAAGFYKSIGTTICMTVNMLAQLFVCVIFYSFMIDLLFTMITVSNNFFVDIAKNVLGITQTSGNSFHAEIMVILGTLFSIFVTVFFVSFAVKWRAAIMNAVNQNTEAVVGTLLGVQLSGASEGGVMGGMARSAFNDAVNITKMGVAAAGVDALAASTQDIVNDFKEANADGEIKEVRGSVSAADSAVNPEAGSTLSGVGGPDNEATSAEEKAEADELLANGVDPDELRAKGIDPDKLQTGGWYHGGADGPDYRIHDAKIDGTPEEYYAKQEESKKNSETSDSTNSENTAEYAEAKTEESAQSGAYSEDEFGDRILLRKDSQQNSNNTNSQDTSNAQNNAQNQNADNTSTYNKADVANSTAASASNNEEEGTLENTSGGDRGDSTQANEDHSLDISTTGGGTGVILSKSKGESITSEAVEDANGEIVWEQTNSELGTTSKISQGENGELHIQTDNENGTASDVVVGSEGTNIKAIDGEGNRSEVTVENNNMDAVYEGVDGSGEKVHAELEGDNAGTVIDKNSPDGAIEHIETGKNGEVVNYSGTSADGKIKKIETDPDTGVQTIIESDPTTGYESVESVSADGSFVKNESANGIKTTTQKDAAGNITSVHTEGTDNNGRAYVSDTSYNADGSSVEILTSGNSTVTTAIDPTGNVTKTNTVTNSDGSTMSTITEFGADNVPDKITEVAADAQGKEIQRTVRASGSDLIGAYTGTTTTTAAGTLETKDYGSGHIVTTETTDNASTIFETTDGGVNTDITTSDLSTGTVTKSSINAVTGTGSSVRYDASGKELASETLSAGSDGIVLGTAAGSALAINALRNGSAVETSTVYTSASGVQSSYGTNTSTGSYQTSFVDAMGGQYSTGYNGGTGDSTSAFTTVSGASGSMVNADNGNNFSSRVIYGSNGGYDNVIRSGSGSAASETITSADMVGNNYRAESVGGEVREIHVNGVDGSSYDQAVENGVVTTSHVAMSGARSVMTNSGNNNYTVESTGFMGDTSTLTSSNDGNNMTYISSSITGIDTTAMRNGSATSTTVQTDSVKIMSSMDEATGAAYNSFANVMSGQTITNGINADGGRQTQIDFADGNYGSFTQNSDGQSVVTISRGSNGAGLTGIGPIDNIQYVYQDANGQIVDTPSMNDAATIPIAQGVMGYAVNAQNGIAAPQMNNNSYDMSGTGMIMPNVETGESTGLGSISLGAAGAAGMAGSAVSSISSSIKKLFKKKVEITEEEEEDEITATRNGEASKSKSKTKRKSLSAPTGTGSSLRRTSGSFGRDKYRDSGSSSNNNSDRA